MDHQLQSHIISEEVAAGIREHIENEFRHGSFRQIPYDFIGVVHTNLFTWFQNMREVNRSNFGFTPNE
jgi:hypothetical protein